jgi:hypothetical protein
MQIEVRVDGEADLRTLSSWLANEPGVSRCEMTAPPVAPGEQGALFDVIQVVLSDGLALASLIVSIKQWQAARPSAPDVVVKSSDGEKQLLPGTLPPDPPTS